MWSLRPFVALSALLLVAGCASRMQAVTPPLTEAPAAGKKGTLTFTITVPKKVNPETKSYVSPASKGLWMAFDVGSKQSVQTSALEKGAKGCAAKGNSLICTITVSLAVGKYQSEIKVYDQPPQGGGFGSGAHILSAQLSGLKYTIVAGKTEKIDPKLEGNIASLAIPNFPQGCITSSGPTAFEVAGSDDDGYTIAGTYLHSIVLSDSDTSGHTTLGVSGQTIRPRMSCSAPLTSPPSRGTASPLPAATR